MYRSKYSVFRQIFFFKNRPQTQCIYKALSHFCVIITRASILLTIPVAFIYTFILKLQIVLLLSVITGAIYRNIYFSNEILYNKSTELILWKVCFSERNLTFGFFFYSYVVCFLLVCFFL